MYIRGEEGDNLSRGEASGVAESLQDAVDGVEGLRDGQVWCWLGRVGAANEHREARSTGTVAHADSTGKLNAASRKAGVISTMYNQHYRRETHKSAVVRLWR